ncbi:MAG: hypothetical protein LBQ23_03390, partial [Puniceicoccales bacterium]|nr:hypothetical protein [Puniceicoccales bacterium]
MSEIELGSPGSSPEVTPSLQSNVNGSPTAQDPSPRTVPQMSGTRLNERDAATTIDNQDTSSVDAQKALKSLLNEKGKEKISSFRAFWEALKQLMSKGGWNFGQAKLNLVVKNHMLQYPSCMKQWAAEIVSMIEILEPSAVKAYINALSQIPKKSGENNPDEVLEQLKDGILARMSSGIKSNNIKCLIDNAHHVIHSSPGSITDDSNRTLIPDGNRTLCQSIDILRKHEIDFMRLIPDKTITGKVFDFIGQLYFRGQYKEISYLPSTT